uniref:Cytochrome c oxidase subunit 2 n=1 Tax=Protohalopteris sp. TaxID=2843287 RepID=A0A8F0FF00_9PHAE|nr:cytochrome oxidase subunit II [Protohalopteris sp.]
MLVFFYIVLFLIFVYYNTPVAGGAPNGNWQSGFQDPATPIMEGIIYLNNQLMFLMILISCFIGWLLFQTLKFYSDFDFHWGVSVENRNKKYSSRVYGKSTHSTMLEIIWTISPAVLLMFIGLPSFSLLYSMDETVDPAITLKVIGHQWYWKGIKFDSYLVPEEDLSIPKLYCTGKVGKVLRLLEVDNRVVLPIYTHIRVLVTGADVLHSWAIPSLGIKVDSCPGRLNQIFLFLKRDGVFYGQCSEICGVNHGFMPIVVKGVALEEYSAWISQRLKNC